MREMASKKGLRFKCESDSLCTNLCVTPTGTSKAEVSTFDYSAPKNILKNNNNNNSADTRNLEPMKK